MSFFNPMMEDMLEVFQTESNEYMSLMEACLMEEEKHNQLSSEALQEIFRIAHTMKSSSAAMGLEEMSSCTHRLEDLFSIYRDQPEKTDGKTTRIFDLLYEYVDYIRSEVQKMDEPDYYPQGTQELCAKIEEELKIEKDEPEEQNIVEHNVSEVKAEHTDVQSANDAYQWKLHFTEQCQMENVRAYLLIKQITSMCGQLYTVPEDLQQQDAAEKIHKEGLILYFTSDESEEIYNKLIDSVYVESIEDMGIVSESLNEVETPEESRSDVLHEEHKTRNKMGMVSWKKILNLQNLTGELITMANMLEREVQKIEQKNKAYMEKLVLDNRHLLDMLEELVNSVSMMPVSSMVNQYNRAIRDVCKKEGKEISFQINGRELEVDKTLIDTLSTPLLHLIRNAADHGIEFKEERESKGKSPVGQIIFSVDSVGENLLFSVSDDGRGLNKVKILTKAAEMGMLTKPTEDYSEFEIYQLIFKAGFSTSETVTEYSGRGVGLDVVQRMTDFLNGSVYVESKLGEGTKVTVTVPASLTSVSSIQFVTGGHIGFIPAKNVIQIYPFCNCQEHSISAVDGREYFRGKENELIPLIRLREMYGGSQMSTDEQVNAFIMVVKAVQSKVAFVIDRVEGQYTIVQKALPELIPQDYRKQMGISGCAVTPEGSIGYILNADWILRAYGGGTLYGQGIAGSEGS